jgi:hypothetical protein
MITKLSLIFTKNSLKSLEDCIAPIDRNSMISRVFKSDQIHIIYQYPSKSPTNPLISILHRHFHLQFTKTLLNQRFTFSSTHDLSLHKGGIGFRQNKKVPTLMDRYPIFIYKVFINLKSNLKIIKIQLQITN